MAQVMRTLSNQMEQARLGTGLAADRFRQLGIDIATVTSTDDLIRKIIDSVGKFADGTGKAALMGQLLGRNWLQIMAAFEGGTEAMNAATVASASLGSTLGGTQLTALLEVHTAVADMGTAWDRFGQQLGAIVAPAMTMILNLFTQWLAWWSQVFHAMDVGLDVLAIKVTHLWLKIKELASMDFSGWFANGEAWTKTLANLKQIDEESAKLIAARLALDTLPPPQDVRPTLTPIVDSQKAMTEARALADSLLKYDEDLYKNKTALSDAYLTNYLAHLNAEKGYAIETDLAIAQSSENAETAKGAFTLAALNTEMQAFLKYFDAKDKLYLGDAKSQAEKAKFEVDASAKYLQLMNEYEVAKLKSDTTLAASARTVSDEMKKAVLQPYDDEIAKLTAVDAAQQALYKDEAGMIGASDAARQVRLTLIDAEAAKERVVLEQTLGMVAQKAQALSAASSADQTLRDTALAAETRLQQAIQNLDLQTDTKRRQTLQAFPTFFESQMEAIKSSNAFSMSTMVSTWSGGIANMIVMGGNLKAAWQQTQVAIVQAFINAGVQQLADAAIAYAHQAALDAAAASAKLTLNTTTNAAIVASNTTAAAVSASVWAGAYTFIAAAGSAALAGFEAMASAMVDTVIMIGNFIVGLLEGISTALKASVVGIPIGVLVGVAAMGLAIFLATQGSMFAAISAGVIGGTSLAFTLLAEGGVVTRPTYALVGESGPEAVIPLNRMSDLGVHGGGGMAQTIVVQLDGREIARNTLKLMPGIVYLKTGLA